MKHHVARITLETKTALAINTGKQDGVFDTSLVTDANGLPAIPATSITGVLRHLFRQFYDKELTNTLFGFQEKSAQSHDDKGQISQLNISWGHLNDSKGKVIEGIDFEDKIASDELLSSAFEQAMISPLIRDRTVSNSRGVSKNKYDVSILQQGHRFSFELSYWDKSEYENTDDSLWEKALMTLFHPLFRLGSNTRNGLGAISIVQLQTRTFGLQEKKGQQAYIKYAQTRALNDLMGFENKLNAYQTQAEAQTEKYLTKISLTLEPTGFWRFGQGNHPQKSDSNNKTPDLLPKMEESIKWDNHKGKVGDLRLLIAASSIKGAIAHRVTFHANRLNNVWAEDFNKDSNDQIATYDKSEECETVKRIFGYAANEKRTENEDIDNKEPGHVGALIINDTYLHYSKDDLKVIMHNSIDRFTSGVRKGMLYSEEMVWGKNIELDIYLDESNLEYTDKQALHLALKDLAEGRLSLGARAAVGHGFFKDTQYQNPFDNTQGKAQGEAQ